MAMSPVPIVAVSGGAKNTAPEDAIPVALYQDLTTNPVVAALIAAGFGEAGQVLATNAAEDGFEWVTP